MLVLSRKSGESILVDDVKITVVRLDRNRVKIGIEAPQERKIIRGELLLDTSETAEQAVASEPVVGAKVPVVV
ncbi:MAG: carbon storage regulator [Planctomycetales bacterium]|nr:carbon storage regulator [Planctomycetales bacterium]